MESKSKINKTVINPLTGGLYHDLKFRKNPTEESNNNLNPLFRPIASKLSVEERVKLALTVGEECINPDELKALFEKNRFVYAYDGFEPSGRMHIAQGVLKAMNVNKLVDAGCIFIFWVADWFALMNNKMQGDLEKIRVVGEYFIEIWKAIGMKMSNVKFIWASDFINQRPNEYWLQVLDVARKNSLHRMKKCAQIMGREESDNLAVSQMIYPCMQCTDIFFMGLDICQLGMDQRKVNMLAREYATTDKPVILSSHMIGGLKEGDAKMSKSNPDTAIFMEDSVEDVRRKIKKSFCPQASLEENRTLEFVKYFTFMYYGHFNIKRDPKNGGDLHYTDFDTFCADYVKDLIHPEDVKSNLAEYINNILDPVRKHFENDPHAKKIYQLVKKYQAENEAAKKLEEKAKNRTGGNKKEGGEAKKEEKPAQKLEAKTETAPVPKN